MGPSTATTTALKRATTMLTTNRSMNRHHRTPALRSSEGTTTKIVRNPRVRGTELLDAVVFLGEALGLPRLNDAAAR
jgi:hypothetical protein